MADAEKPQIIVLEPCTKTVEDLLKIIEEKSQAELIRVGNADEAQQLARHHQPCMLVACIQENAEIPARVNMLKKLEGSIKKGLLKTLFVSKLKNRQINTLITSLGVTDFMEEPVPVRTMAFKANLQLKAIQTIRKQQAQKAANEEKIVFKKSEAKKDGDRAVNSDSTAKSAPALSLQEDTFLFRNSGAKKVGKKVMVEVEGPTPESGDWVPHEDKGNAQTSWRWVPKEEKAAEAAGKPAEGWVHEGDKPQFQEATGKWQLASEKPDLSFRKNGEKIASKISTDENGELVVAADSPAAEENVKKSKALAEKRKEEAAKDSKKLSANPADTAKAEEIKLGKEIKPEAEASKSAFNNKTGGVKAEGKILELGAAAAEEAEIESKLAKDGANGESAEVVELKDRRGPEQAKVEKKKAGQSPLDFLKNKKELLEKSGLPSSDPAEEQEISADSKDSAGSEGEELATFNGLKPSEAPTAQAPKKKNSASAAQDALARMKAKLGDTSLLDEAEETELESPAAESAEETLEEAEGSEDDSTSPEAKLRDSTPGRVQAGKKAKQRAAPSKVLAPRQVRKKEILKEIQEILQKPLPEKIPLAQETALRKKLGLENRPEIAAKELARKDRIQSVKELKDRLGEIDLEPETLEDAPETIEHDLKPDEIDNTWSKKGELSGKAESKIRAFDSDLEEKETAETGREKVDREAKAKRDKKDSSDPYVYLPQDELTPQGGAWELATSHYVFLAAEIRYHGFKKLEDLLPLWIYEGEKVPELLDRTKQWRFLEQLPKSAKTTAEIPREVRDFLLGLRDQLVREGKDKKLDTNGKPEKKKSYDLGQSIDEVIAEREENSDGGAEEELGKELDGEEIRGEEINGNESGSEENPAEIEATDSSPAIKSEKKAARPDLSKMLASLEEEQAGLDERAEEEKIASEERAEESEKAGERASEDSEIKSENPEQANNELGLEERVSEKLALDSAAMEKFNERRKRKKEARDESLEARVKGTDSQEEKSATNPYLGIFVTLSNSLGPHKDPARPIMRVLKSIESSFGDCAACYLGEKNEQGQAPILIGSGVGATTGDHVDLSSGLFRPVVSGSGESAKILGYLFLRAVGKRQTFTKGEEVTMDKVAISFTAVVQTESDTSEKKAA